MAGFRPHAQPQLHRVRHGVYAQADEWATLAPWGRYLARVHAYALTSSSAVFALESAAVLHGLPVFGEPSSIHLFDPDRKRSVRYGDVEVHTSRDSREISPIGRTRLLATSLPETVVDLGRVLSPARGLAVVDASLSARMGHACCLDQLASIAAAQCARRGVRVLEWLWARASGVAESVGESVSRAVIEWCGFDEPALQEEFHFEGETDRPDFFWRHGAMVGESDGYGKYDGDAEKIKSALIREKTREDRLRRHLGGFARWDMRDAVRVDPLAQKLLAAGVQVVADPQRAMLATLSRHR
ncbi:hypothetical protein [Microbacterium sp. C7(2022)]|uniref:hypothetical protein n=1 Tax=Microbacterium sp. C7(2022) TaxID=2992759 RepID=UPI00237C3C03|nr:hypothetical protein [Microbacterium sp. C7(2022)]MDE0545733.1 hypothetical protein [Microbacterium sp. C7(2022)]